MHLSAPALTHLTDTVAMAKKMQPQELNLKCTLNTNHSALFIQMNAQTCISIHTTVTSEFLLGKSLVT